MTTPFQIGSSYKMTFNKFSNVKYVNVSATFKGMERENDDVMLAVFVTHMDGEEICIDMDFIDDWSINEFQYT